MCSRTSVNRLKAHNNDDDDDDDDDYDDDDDNKDDDDDDDDDDDNNDDPLECEVALFSAALQAGHVAVHRHHMPVTHRRHLEGAHLDDDDDYDDRPR